MIQVAHRSFTLFITREGSANIEGPSIGHQVYLLEQIPRETGSQGPQLNHFWTASPCLPRTSVRQQNCCISTSTGWRSGPRRKQVRCHHVRRSGTDYFSTKAGNSQVHRMRPFPPHPSAWRVSPQSRPLALPLMWERTRRLGRSDLLHAGRNVTIGHATPWPTLTLIGPNAVEAQTFIPS
jgi:hypothetical protein